MHDFPVSLPVSPNRRPGPVGPAERPAGATRLVSLRLVDPHQFDLDDDTWIEWCVHCGTLDNAGDLLCAECLDAAA